MTRNQKMHRHRSRLNTPRQGSHSPPVMPQPLFPAPLFGFARALCRFGGAFHFERTPFAIRSGPTRVSIGVVLIVECPSRA